jgi:NAD(P)-dependent dehydrogenase (short-subunit alcohol dehydrogenase family)
MSLPLEGLSSIVTGAGRGLGRAEALELARLGAAVVVNDYGQPGRDGSGEASTAPAEEVAAEIRAAGGNALAHTGDVADFQQAEELVGLAAKEFGKLDILVNSAATVTPSDFFAIDDERWVHDVFEEKLNGYARMLRHAVPAMKARKYGRILNISGVAARQPHAPTVTVGVNNAAVLNLTKALAGVLAKDGITCNAVIPHIINTDRQDETMVEWAKITGQTEAEVRAERVARIPVGRMGKPQEVGDVVAFLVSERASFVNGAALHVDGGVTLSI